MIKILQYIARAGCLTFIVAGIPIGVGMCTYHSYSLREYHGYIPGRVTSFHIGGKGNDADYSFYLNGKKYTGNSGVGRKTFQAGDTVTIIFSREDPSIHEIYIPELQ